MYICWEDWSGRGRFNPTALFHTTFLNLYFLRCTRSLELKCAAYAVTSQMRKEFKKWSNCWQVGRPTSLGHTRVQATQLTSQWLLRKYTGAEKLTECNFCFAIFVLFRFPDQSDNRFFWNRMLYLPYVRAGVSTSDWLIKVHSCLSYKNLLILTHGSGLRSFKFIWAQMTKTSHQNLKGDVRKRRNSHSVCWG